MGSKLTSYDSGKNDHKHWLNKGLLTLQPNQVWGNNIICYLPTNEIGCKALLTITRASPLFGIVECGNQQILQIWSDILFIF